MEGERRRKMQSAFRAFHIFAPPVAETLSHQDPQGGGVNWRDPSASETLPWWLEKGRIRGTYILIYRTTLRAV
jgi:hypothetical protein